MEGHVGGRDDHGAFGHSVLWRHREVLLGKVRDHDDRGTVAESLLDNGASPLELLNGVKGKRGVDIAVPGLDVFLADLVKVLGSVGHDLEQPCSGRGGGVLRGEEECEDGHGDFKVAEPADHGSGLLRVIDLFACLDPLAVLFRLNHVIDPKVQNAFLLAPSSHADLALCGALGELVENHVGALFAVPGLGEGNDDWEVDQLKGGGNQIVVVGNLLDSLVGAVVANKGAAAKGRDHQTEFLHPGHVLALILNLGKMNELLKVSVVDVLLARKVLFKRLASEETVEALAVVDVGAAIEENPVFGAQELVGDIDDARLNKCWRIEDLAGHVAGRSNDDEPGSAIRTCRVAGWWFVGRCTCGIPRRNSAGPTTIFRDTF